MRLVIDANILFSALLRDSGTRKIIVDRSLDFFAPRFLLEELLKYAPELRKKSRLDQTRFTEITTRLVARVSFVSNEELEPFLPAAAHLVNDTKDIAYAACALAANADVWSQDRHFSNSRIRVWRTTELLEKLYSKP